MQWKNTFLLQAQQGGGGRGVNGGGYCEVGLLKTLMLRKVPLFDMGHDSKLMTHDSKLMTHDL